MSPALLAAIATIVPTVSTPARAPASTQPAAAKIDAVPSSVTSAIPEVGCDDTPTMPTIRAATATNSTPNNPDAGREHRPLQRRHVPGEHARDETRDQHDERDAAEHEARRQVAVGPLDRGAARAAAAQPASDRQERAGHRRQPAQHGDDARGGHRSRADVAHVARPDVVGAHLRHEPLGLGVERRGQRRRRARR